VTASEIEVEARSYELDAYGHLNNAVHVNWLEHGRLCFLRERGHSFTSIPEAFGVHVMVVHLELSYKATTRIARLGRSSFTFAQQLTHADGRLAAEGTATLACAGPEGKAVSIPPALRELLSRGPGPGS
jgi:acyl-CoA thioester hydrolase